MLFGNKNNAFSSINKQKLRENAFHWMKKWFPLTGKR